MPTLEELAAQLATLQNSVPSLEDLPPTSVRIDNQGGALSITSSTRFVLLVADIPMRILSVTAAWEGFNLPGSDTSYWTGAIEHGVEATGYPDMAVKTTQNTGALAHGPIAKRTPWGWESANWATMDVAAGELLTMNWAPTGSPPALDIRMTVTIRSRPL